jgi:hypothetical protein
MRATLIGLTLLLAALAGCSNAAAPAASNAAGAAAPMLPAAPPHAAQAITGGAGAPQSHAATRLAANGAQIVYTAQLTLRARNVGATLDAASVIAQSAGGYVSAENATGASATITLKIPVLRYPAALARLDGGRLGQQVSLQRGAQEVTQAVADVSSQVTSDEDAIAQLRSLLSRAGSVGDLLTVQNQIDTEESALESELAQQRALNTETAFATVTITVIRPATAPPVKEHSHTPGLLAGLSGGWRAFRTAWSWLLAVLGATAPFAATAVVAALALYAARRRLRARH